MKNRSSSVDLLKLQPMTGQEFEDWLLSKEKTLHGRRITEEVSKVCGKLYKKYLTDCAFEQPLDICAEGVYYLIFENCVCHSKVEIQANTIDQTIRFERCALDYLEIKNCSNGEIDIMNSEIDKNLSLLHLNNWRQVELSNLLVKGRISLVGLESDEISSITLKNVICQGRLRVSGYERTFNKLELNQGKYHWIEIGASIPEIDFLGEDETLEAGTIDFIGYNHPSKVSLQNVKVDDLLMNDVIGEQTSFELLDVTICNSWVMNFAAPEQFAALSLNLSGCKIYFDHSLLSDCVFSNVQWPKRNTLHSVQPDGKKKNASLQEAYRQLKQAMLKDGNNIEALAFYRNELEEYRAFVNDNPEVKREDKIILWMMWFFSDHGQSFARPIAWLLGMHLVLFLIAIAVGYNDFYYTTNHDWSAVWDFIGSYFYLLNPVHRLPDTNGGMLIVDFFMRLSSGFFIYHIICASRKFAKV